MIGDSDSEINPQIRLSKDEYPYNEDEYRRFSKGIKEIYENEISEPEIMLFVRDDQNAVELLQKYSTLAKDNNYDSLILSINNTHYNENYDKEKKVYFIRNFYLGVSYFKRLQFEEALKYYLEANKIYKFYQLNYNIGLCYMRINKYEQAVYYFDSVIKENKNNIFGYYNLIKIFLRQKNYNDAYLLYHEFQETMKNENKERLTDKLEGNTRLTANLANINYIRLFYKIGAECCFAKSLYQECIHTILEGLKFNPEDPDLWCLYAKVFIIKKNYGFAKPLLRKALEHDSNHKEAKELLDTVEMVDYD